VIPFADLFRIAIAMGTSKDCMFSPHTPERIQRLGKEANDLPDKQKNLSERSIIPVEVPYGLF